MPRYRSVQYHARKERVPGYMGLMVVGAVVFDIGGVLEITPDLGVAQRWEARLGLPAGGKLVSHTREQLNAAEHLRISYMCLILS
jgi:hypothetical protein